MSFPGSFSVSSHTGTTIDKLSELMAVSSLSTSPASAASSACAQIADEVEACTSDESAALRAQLQIREAEVTQLSAQLEISQQRIRSLELSLGRQMTDSSKEVAPASPTSGATVKSLPYDVRSQIKLQTLYMLDSFVKGLLEDGPIKEEMLRKIEDKESIPLWDKSEEVLQYLEKTEVPLTKLKQTLETLGLTYTASKIPV